MNDPELRRPSSTEDAPAAPAWAETELDEIFAQLPHSPVLTSLRGTYLDCLAGVAGPADMEGGRDRCRAALLRGLEGERIAQAELNRLDERLAALEAEITART